MSAYIYYIPCLYPESCSEKSEAVVAAFLEGHYPAAGLAARGALDSGERVGEEDRPDSRVSLR